MIFSCLVFDGIFEKKLERKLLFIHMTIYLSNNQPTISSFRCKFNTVDPGRRSDRSKHVETIEGKIRLKSSCIEKKSALTKIFRLQPLLLIFLNETFSYF